MRVDWVRPKRQSRMAAAAAVGVALCGAVLTWGIHAATVNTASEIESGTVSSAASIASDSSASGGRAVKFGSGAVSGGGTGSPLSGLMVALGDSYTSGYGAPPYAASSGGCYISQSNAYVNYAKTQLAALGGTVTYSNHACAGAKSSDTVGGGLAVVTGAKWVVMTIGGNDYDLVTSLTEGTYGLQNITAHQADITAGVANVVNVAKQSAPSAQYYILGYPDIMPPTGTNISACFGSAASSIDLSSDHQMYTIVNQALQNAATQSGAHFVETTSHFTGHDMCSAGSWFTPYGEADSWHPTSTGQQELGTLLAQAIEAAN